MLLGYAISKVDRQLGVDQIPVLSPSAPLFRNIHNGQIQHFQQTVIVRKDGFCLGYIVQLTVKLSIALVV